MTSKAKYFGPPDHADCLAFFPVAEIFTIKLNLGYTRKVNNNEHATSCVILLTCVN